MAEWQDRELWIQRLGFWLEQMQRVKKKYYIFSGVETVGQRQNMLGRNEGSNAACIFTERKKNEN